MILLPVLLSLGSYVCTEAFSIHTGVYPTITPTTRSAYGSLLLQKSACASRYATQLQISAESTSSETKKLVHIEAIACAGLSKEELPIILSAASEAVVDHFGIEFEFEIDSIHHDIEPAVPESVPGATGRVLLLSLNNVADDWEEDDERLDQFKILVSTQIDSLVGDQIEQPVLVTMRPNYKSVHVGDNAIDISEIMSKSVHNEATMYGLCAPMVSDAVVNGDDISPAIHVEIDGAMVPDPFTKEEVWDTSSVLVFDDFVDDSLRERLLDVVNKREEGYSWDDKIHGPDPKRWTRGGLMDTPVEDEMDDAYNACWGLSEEATNDLCFEEHYAIKEVEQKISNFFAADFSVSRFPEAVLGACVSPLTANAPTFGDSFAFHIDADPNQTPPSPWTDVFGRYFNRVRGKPRLVSVLLYLNDEWGDDLGAPTQFYDPPTESTYEVYPRPGRCVIMDQDVTHTVVAPNEIAGAQPRYSLVWKLILHPKKEKQSMKLPSYISKVRIGSANNGE